jgi:small subunit ribosomal protein S20
MAHHKSAIKRIKTAEKARLANRTYRKEMKKSIKIVLEAADKETALPLLQKVESKLDRMSIKGLIHKNKAANQKSRLNRFVNGLN